MSICRCCWDRIKAYHKTSTERLLARYIDIIAFNTTSSRWGFASVLSTIFSFLIAFAIGVLALALSFYAIEGNKMTWWIWGILIFAMLIGLVGFAGMILIGWISLYFIRVPLKGDAPILTSINKSVSEDIPSDLRNINSTLSEISRNTGQIKGKKR